MQLQKHVDIVIKPPDKGSGIAITDRDWYINECLKQLNDNKYYENKLKTLQTEYKTELKNTPLACLMKN